MNCPYIAEYKHVRIRPLEKKDIEFLRVWRNDKSISTFLRPIGEITPEMQEKWYEGYLKDPDIIQFAIEETSELHRMVGSVALYDFNGSEAEVGKIVVGDPEAKGKKIGYYGLILAMHVGYQKLGISKYIGDVHEDNASAKINDLRAGFVIKGKHPFVTGGYELEIEVTKEHFEETHDFLKDIKILQECNDGFQFYVGQMGWFSKTLTETDAYLYAGISGDFNPVHINCVEATNSTFGRQVCHGMLTASLISTVIGTVMPGKGTIYLGQNLKFIRPVYFGDTITAKVTIIQIDEIKRQLTLKTEEFNQDGVIVVTGEAKVKV